jgi:vitamin B12 transporter
MAFRTASGILLLTLASAAFAQQETPPKEKPLSEEKEVEVTSTRLETPLKESGASTTVVGSERIREEHPDSVVDLLRGLPGFHLARTGIGRTGVNSLFTRGTNSNHTLLLVDGFQVTRDGGRFFEFDLLPADNLDRVEALRGPSSALYGSDAMGGVVNFISRRGEGPATARFSLEGGTFSASRAVAELFGGDAKTAYSFALSRYEQADGQEDHSDFENLSFAGRVDYQLAERTHVRLVSRYVDSEQETPYNSGGVLVAPEGEGRREDELLLLGLEFTQWIGDSVEAKLRVSRVSQDQFSTDLADAVDTGDVQITSAFDRNLAELVLNGYAGKWAVFTAGAEYETEELESVEYYNYPLFFFSSTTFIDESRSNKAFFAQAAFRFWERLFITPGIRLEDNQEYGTDPNARIAVAYLHLESQTKFRASWGTGITEPRLDQNFGFYGNPDLEPEQVVGWDAGVDQWLFDDAVRLGLTYFENRLSDMIVLPYLAPGAVYVNGGDGIARGVEAEAEAKLFKVVVLGASYTFLRTRATDVDAPVESAPTFVEDDVFLRRPTHSGRAYLGIRWEERLSLFLDVTYVGNREDSSFTTTPAVREKNDDYWKTDLSLGVDLFGGLRFVGRVENLLDVAYQEVLGYPGAHAAWLAGFEYTIKL